jgi:acetylornithine deacetylase
MVVDCEAKGIAGHAARKEGENALYKAVKDIQWILSYQFDKVSDLLGETTMSVTVIETDNKQHNVVPSSCKYVIDVRSNELYTFEEIVDLLKKNLSSEIAPRSMRLRSTSISLQHPLVKAGISLGRSYYGSPTTSDKALMSFPALKMGPGDSARSHTADEFIYLEEIREGIELYVELMKRL